MKPSQDVYAEPYILNLPGAVVTIHRPILTEAERARRMKAIHDAAADLLKSIQK